MNFSQQQINQLAALTNQKRFDLAYDLLAGWVKVEADKLPNNHETKLIYTWLRGAGDINRGQGSFANLVLTYNQTQGKLRGKEITLTKNKEASDHIASKVFQFISTHKKLPSFKDIRDFDARGGQFLYDFNMQTDEGKNASNWSGVFLISPFGYDDTARLLTYGKDANFDTLGDMKNALYAYYSFWQALKVTASKEIIQIIENIPKPIINDKSNSLKYFEQLFSNIYTGYMLPEKSRLMPDMEDITRSPMQSVIFNLIKGRTAEKAFSAIDRVDGAVNALNQLTSTWYGIFKLSVTEDNFITEAIKFFSLFNESTLDSLKIEDIGDKTTDEIIKLANTHKKYRNSLKVLSNFVLDLSDKQYENRELELYSSNNPNGLTSIYIQKRAEMLVHLTKNMTSIPDTGLDYYQDLVSGQSVGSATNIANAPHLTTNEKIIFGTNDNDVTTLVGNDKGDFLFGGKGNDTLNGKGGNDYLEGGLDYDTYHIDGKDTIFDADMKGKVLLKDVKQAGFIQVNTTTWVSVDKSTTAKRVNNDLVIVKGNDEATIKDYFKLATKISDNTWSGLDIWLSNMPFQMLPNKKDKINKYTIFTENNVIIDGSSKADLISANNAGRMIVKTGDGNDVVVSGYKADMIEGGAGNDVLVGSEPVSARDGSLDHDELVGGDGRDLVFGGDGNDVIHAGNRSEHLSVQAINEFGDIVIGGAGNDVVYGGVRNDFVQGGEGKDTLWGGAGMDILLGDGYIRPFNKFTPVATSATPKFKPLPLDAVGSPTAVAEAAISAIANSSLAVEFKLDNKQTNPLQFAELKGVGLLDDKISNWTFSINTNTGDYSFSKTGNELRRNFHVVEADNKRDDGDTLYGGAGNDLVIGQRGNDMLYGDIGNDILWGDDNRDKTISGSDVLDGGAGLDNLYGGLGADTFVFKKADVKAGEADIIHDAEQIDKLIFDNKQLNLEKWNLLAGKSNLWENATKNLQLELNGKDLTLSQVLNNQKTAIAVVKNFDSGDLGLNLPTKAAVSSRSAEYSYANTETITPYYHESNQYI